LAELNNNYTFATLQEYPENMFALSAAKAIIVRQGKAYNPVYVYGKKGSGKTHLVQALAYECLKKGYMVTYAASAEFCREMKEKYNHLSLSNFINKDYKALTEREREINNKIIENDIYWQAFNTKYCLPDVLIFEDIDSLPEGNGYATELFHLVLPPLIDNKRQIIITANKPVHKLDNLDDYEKKVLGQGLVVEIRTALSLSD
jgi:chromosomal replication initiator protein